MGVWGIRGHQGCLNAWGIKTYVGCPDAPKHMGDVNSMSPSDFEQFLLWEAVVVLKELILNSFYFGRVWHS